MRDAGWVVCAAMAFLLPGGRIFAKGRPAVIVVFDIEDTRAAKARLSHQDLAGLTAYLSAQLAVDSSYKVVPPEQVKAALTSKKSDSYKACYNEACQIEIGKELAAEKSVATKIIEVGAQCILTSTLYDLREAASEKAATSRGACGIAALTDAVEKVASQLRPASQAQTDAGDAERRARAQGCSDGTREGFIDLSSYPDIAGCSGAWSIPGVGDLKESPSWRVGCDRASGNTGTNPRGAGCTVEDLCSVGWHVCLSPAEVASKSRTGCKGAAPAGSGQLFFAQRKTGGGSGKCDGKGMNDIFGCGNYGTEVFPESGCEPLDRFSNDLCSGLPGGIWSCGTDGEREASAVVKTRPDQGGVLCCRGN